MGVDGGVDGCNEVTKRGETQEVMAGDAATEFLTAGFALAGRLPDSGNAQGQPRTRESGSAEVVLPGRKPL